MSLRLPGNYTRTPSGVVAHATQVATSRVQSLLEDGQIRGLRSEQLQPLSELYDELCCLSWLVRHAPTFKDLRAQKEIALAINVTDVQTFKSLQTFGVTTHCGNDPYKITELWDSQVCFLMAKYDALEDRNGVGHGLHLGHRAVAEALTNLSIAQECPPSALSGKRHSDDNEVDPCVD